MSAAPILSSLPIDQVKEHDAIVGEKSVLFGQLMKRNDELSALYDKIRIQTSSLHQGEVRSKLCRVCSFETCGGRLGGDYCTDPPSRVNDPEKSTTIS